METVKVYSNKMSVNLGYVVTYMAMEKQQSEAMIAGLLPLRRRNDRCWYGVLSTNRYNADQRNQQLAIALQSRETTKDH